MSQTKSGFTMAKKLFNRDAKNANENSTINNDPAPMAQAPVIKPDPVEVIESIFDRASETHDPVSITAVDRAVIDDMLAKGPDALKYDGVTSFNRTHDIMRRGQSFRLKGRWVINGNNKASFHPHRDINISSLGRER